MRGPNPMLEALVSEFARRHGRRARAFSAPGRINLIGEHTDYNDGFVLPAAIDRRTYVAAAARDDRRIVAQSLDVDGDFELDLDRPGPVRRGIWGDYVEGMARALMERGFSLRGADLLIASELSPGAGVSASAALELAVGLGLVCLGGASDPDRVALALSGQDAEHRYVGTLCGIMDQLVIALAEEQKALLIDCRSLDRTPVPVDLEGRSLVVMDTQVKHRLAASEYNRRREECEESVSLLARFMPGLRSLRDVSPDDLRCHGEALPEVLLRRARHVVSENARTLSAAAALKNNDLARFGTLMLESHASLRDDYQVSCAELDLAVETAGALPGVLGARMTGGGFGGSAIALGDGALPSRLETALEKAFYDAGFQEPQVFLVRLGGGAREEPGAGL